MYHRQPDRQSKICTVKENIGSVFKKTVQLVVTHTTTLSFQ
jgi:hypothetical protein